MCVSSFKPINHHKMFFRSGRRTIIVAPVIRIGTSTIAVEAAAETRTNTGLIRTDIAVDTVTKVKSLPRLIVTKMVTDRTRTEIDIAAATNLRY